jgi:methylglutamate dehydrogenase subunit D
VAEPGLTPMPPLRGVLKPGRHGRPEGPPGVYVMEREEFTLVNVIARKNEAAALATLLQHAYGLELPTAPRLVSGPWPDGRLLTFIWSGPGQWLAYAESGGGLEDELVMALGRRAMVAKQSDGRCLLRIWGPKARDVLAKGISLDLDPRVFKQGDVALTMAAHISVQLWQLDDTPTYEIALFRSLAASFWSWLSASAAEFGYEVLTGGR